MEEEEEEESNEGSRDDNEAYEEDGAEVGSDARGAPKAALTFPCILTLTLTASTSSASR